MSSSAVKSYLERKKLLSEANMREICLTCMRPMTHCYCMDLSPVSSFHKVVILIHPEESRHPVATGRMTHLSLKNSEFIKGLDFSENKKWISLVEKDFENFYLVFPSEGAISVNKDQRFRQSSIPATFVLIDSKWRMAKRMIDSCPFLSNMKRVSFTTDLESSFKVRTQPKKGYLSTIEATSELLSYVDSSFDKDSRRRLLHPFEKMVEEQITYTPTRHLQNTSKNRIRNERIIT